MEIKLYVHSGPFLSFDLAPSVQSYTVFMDPIIFCLMCWDYRILYVHVSFYNITKFFKNITLHIKLKNPSHHAGLQTSQARKKWISIRFHCLQAHTSYRASCLSNLRSHLVMACLFQLIHYIIWMRMFKNLDYWNLDYFSQIYKYNKSLCMEVGDAMILVSNFV
jgi:hypothetical protein